MTTPDETAKKILRDVMYRPVVRFSEFRMKMLEEHPDYLPDDEIHDLYMKHVMGWEVVEVPLAEPDPKGFDGSEACLCDPQAHPHMDCPVHNPWQPALKALDQIIEIADANRATPQEVRKVAERKPQVRYSKKSRRKKKSLGDVTLREAFIDSPRRVAKGLFSRDA